MTTTRRMTGTPAINKATTAMTETATYGGFRNLLLVASCSQQPSSSRVKQEFSPATAVMMPGPAWLKATPATANTAASKAADAPIRTCWSCLIATLRGGQKLSVGYLQRLSETTASSSALTPPSRPAPDWSRYPVSSGQTRPAACAAQENSPQAHRTARHRAEIRRTPAAQPC
jgi:hypothetical protein